MGEEPEAHQRAQPGGLHGAPQLRAGHESPGGPGESSLAKLCVSLSDFVSFSIHFTPPPWVCVLFPFSRRKKSARL